MQSHNCCWQWRTVFKQPRTTKAITAENTKIKDDACRRSAAPFSLLILLILLKKYSGYIHSNIQKYSHFPLILHLLRTQSKVSSTAQLSCSNKIPLWLRKTEHYNCCNATLKDLTAAHHIPTDGVAKRVGSKEQTAECRTSLITASSHPLMDIFDRKKGTAGDVASKKSDYSGTHSDICTGERPVARLN